MAWIELHQAVWTHRKTIDLAERLNLSETHAAAHVAPMWTWAVDNAPSGDLSRTSGRAIAKGAGWPAETRDEAQLFVDALVASGWLDADLSIHDWDEYAGRMIARREYDSRRKRASRTCPPDVRCNDDTSGRAVRRTVQYSTGQYSTGKSLPSVDMRAGANGADAPPKSAARQTKTAKKSSASDAPESLEPTVADITCGMSLGFGPERIEREISRMLDYFRSKGVQRIDWHATLRNWLRKASEIDQSRPPLASSPDAPSGPTGPVITDRGTFIDTEYGEIKLAETGGPA